MSFLSFDSLLLQGVPGVPGRAAAAGLLPALTWSLRDSTADSRPGAEGPQGAHDSDGAASARVTRHVNALAAPADMAVAESKKKKGGGKKYKKSKKMKKVRTAPHALIKFYNSLF